MGTSAQCRSVMIAPIFLRLSLGLIFVWAGLGKVSATMPVSPGQAAVLDRLGISVPPTPSPSASSPTSQEPAGSAAASPTSEAESKKTSETTGAPSVDGTTDRPHVRRLWGIALRIDSAANPEPDAQGAARPAIWPRSLGSGPWPKVMAIDVAATEIGCGLLVLLGLFTRLGAAGLGGVMLGAVWLDQIGSAIQAGNTVMWVIPGHTRFDAAAWMPLFFQLSLLASACALMLLGAGAVSLDRLLFGHRGGGDDDEL